MFGGAQNNQGNQESHQKKRKLSNSKEDMMEGDLIENEQTEEAPANTKRKRSKDTPTHETPTKKGKMGLSKSICEVMYEVNQGVFDDFRALLVQDKQTCLLMTLGDNLYKPHEKSGLFLAQALVGTPVKTLDFSRGRYLNAQSIVQLCAHLQSTQVEKLNFYGCEISSSQAVEILQALKGSPVRQVNFHTNKITSEYLEQMMQLACEQQLLSLDLGYSNIGLKGAQIIAKYLPHSSLISLGIHGCRITPKGAKAIAKVLQICALETLRVGGGHYFQNGAIGDKGIIALSQALPSSKIKELELSRSKMTFIGLAELMNVLPYTSIKKLDIHRNPLSGYSYHLNAGLIGSSVTHLELWESFKDIEVLELVNMIPKTRLVSINKSIQGGNTHPEIVEQALKENHNRLLALPYWLARLKGDPLYGQLREDSLSYANKLYETLDPQEQTQFACEIISQAPRDVTTHILSFLPLMNTHKSSLMLSQAKLRHPQGVEREQEPKPPFCTFM